jgi:iron-sulfur cluster assembly accessory protein
MQLEIDQLAVKKIKELRPTPESALRVTLKGGGCSGLSISMVWVHSPEDSDIIVLKDDIQVFVDSKSSLFLDGFMLSYNDSLTDAGFKLNKPGVSFCGCGQSFTL